jgi:hypothetical protein
VTYEEAEELAGLIAGWTADGSPVTLTCAQDVFGELQETSLLAGTDVQVMTHYEPGQWKLMRHDSCTVLGGETIDQALIISHESCTILGENR